MILLVGIFSNNLFAQNEASTIRLEQTEGEFTIQSLTLDEGTYVFEITNKGVDHEVGFVVAPEGKTEQKHHIKEAYVTKTAKNGQTSTSKTVTLKKGNYVYFCPLNPTPQYKLTVK
jgi:plastocyanin